MGVALWRRSVESEDEPAPPTDFGYLPPPMPGCRYRIEVMGEPRAPWRSTPAEAMVDAIALDLANWDETTREHYLAVPVDMRVIGPEGRA